MNAVDHAPEEAPDDAVETRGILPRTAAFLVVSFGGALLIRWLDLGWIGPAGFVVLMVVATVLFFRSIQRISAASGCASPAMLRYNSRMMRSAIAYTISLVAATFVYKHFAPAPPLLALVAMVPAAAVLAMIWSMACLILEETDEYLRFRTAKQALFATAGLLAVSTIWGFLEMFRLVPHIPAWASVPVFAIMLGIGKCFRGIRS
ncbi:MAG: hypothetical protein RLZZ08_422 [Pseudomonadota bacterium]